MSRFSFGSRFLTIAALALITLTASSLSAQTPRRRRETSANRRARIARQIEDTYSHRWEAAGGGGYLRFRSGADLRKNNEVTFFTTGTYYLNPEARHSRRHPRCLRQRAGRQHDLQHRQPADLRVHLLRRSRPIASTPSRRSPSASSAPAASATATSAAALKAFPPLTSAYGPTAGAPPSPPASTSTTTSTPTSPPASPPPTSAPPSAAPSRTTSA